MSTTQGTVPSSDPRTHHHHGNPDPHGADDVEFVVEDLLDGLRAGLRGTDRDPAHKHTIPDPLLQAYLLPPTAPTAHPEH